MDLSRIILGIAGLAVAANGMKRSVEYISDGLEKKNKLPPLIDQGKHQRTLAGPVRTTRRVVRSLEERITQISDLANQGKFDPEVIAWTRAQLSRKCRPGNNGEQWCVPEKNTLAEVKAIHDGLRRDVRYTSDINGADTYQHPRVTLRLKTADCDDYSSLAAAALMSVGIPVRFKVIRTKDASTWNHIYVQAGVPKSRPQRWISIDASMPNGVGWEAPPSLVAESKIFYVQ